MAALYRLYVIRTLSCTGSWDTSDAMTDKLLHKIMLPGMLAVIAAGVFFRFYNIDKKLLWHDEVYTKFFAAGSQSREWKKKIFTGRVLDVAEVKKLQENDPEKGVVDTIKGLARDEPQHPPLYYILARLWVSCFGDGIGILRLLSALLSLFALPAIFWLSWELFSSRKISWLSVVLLSVSPFFVLFAQEAREYALWSVLILASSAAMLRALRLTSQKIPLKKLLVPWFAYSLLATCAMYTSFSSIFVIMVQVLYVAVHERFRISRSSLAACLSLLLSGAAFLPWALVFLDHYQAFRASMEWSRKIVIPKSELLSTLALNISRPLLDFWRGYDHWFAAAGVVLVLVLVLTSLVVIYRKAPRLSTLFVYLLIFLPIAILLVPDLLFGGIRSVSSRYLTPSLLGIIIAAAYLLGSKLGSSKFQAPIVALIIILATASCAWNSSQFSVWTKGISFNLPKVAKIINSSPKALVVGDQERHNPGNMLALVHLLKPGTKVQFITTEKGYALPAGTGDVYLFTPTRQFRKAIEQREHARTKLLFRDIYMELWKVLQDP